MVRGKPWYGELMTFLVALAMGMMLSVTFFQVRLYKLSYLWNFISLRNRQSLFQKLLECLMFVVCSKIAPKLYRIDHSKSIWNGFYIQGFCGKTDVGDGRWTKWVGDNKKMFEILSPKSLSSLYSISFWSIERKSKIFSIVHHSVLRNNGARY